MRLTRIGASSSAKLAMRDGSPAERIRGDREADTRSSGAGAGHEHQRAAGTHPGHGLASDLEWQHEVLVEGTAHLGEVDLGQRRVVGAAGGDHHVVDGIREVLEEPRQLIRVGGVERRRAARRRVRWPLAAGGPDPDR